MKKHRDGSISQKARFTLQADDTIPSMLRKRAERHPDAVVVEKTSAVGARQPVTAADLQRQVEDVARGLLGLGIQTGEKVAILSSTSYEWMLLDLAILTIGAVTVPIYESDSTTQIRHILDDVFTWCKSLQQPLSRQSLSNQLKLPRYVQWMLLTAEHCVRSLPPDESSPVCFRRACYPLHRRRHGYYHTPPVRPGVPKGVVLTHGNFVGTAEAVRQALPDVIDAPSLRMLLFLPLAHVLARFVMHALLSARGVIAFSPDVKRLLTDIEAFQPTILLAVPRVLEKVYNAASAKAGSGLKRQIFGWSAKQSRHWSAAKEGLSAPLPCCVHAIASPISSSYQRCAASWAPILNTSSVAAPHFPLSLPISFGGTGITVIQGYGLSETTGPIAAQLPGYSPMGTVGPILPGNAVKISDEGEILIKGVSVMQGYHNLPEETSQAIQDGWFHTGDLGSVDRKGNIRITGRKKEIIVTAGGKKCVTRNPRRFTGDSPTDRPRRCRWRGSPLHWCAHHP